MPFQDFPRHTPQSLSAAHRRCLVGLVGHDILASRSPWLHEREGAVQGLNLVYSLFDFAATGRGAEALPRLLDAAAETGFAGLNVTHPFKQQVIPCLDELSPGAARIGAVNTVVFRDGRKIGHNTDVTGFARSLARGLPEANLSCVVQFGAGGAGAATAHALLESGAMELRLVDTEPSRREGLVDKLQREFPDRRVVAAGAVAAEIAAVLNGATGLVNATPMGMAKYPGTPVAASHLCPDRWVADIVYFPLETQLLRDACATGCRTLDGSGMAVFQASDAFDLFTGLKSDPERMLRSFVESIHRPVSAA